MTQPKKSYEDGVKDGERGQKLSTMEKRLARIEAMIAVLCRRHHGVMGADNRFLGVLMHSLWLAITTTLAFFLFSGALEILDRLTN